MARVITVDLAVKLSDLREARDSNPKVWDLRLDTVAFRCLTLKDQRGWYCRTNPPLREGTS